MTEVDATENTGRRPGYFFYLPPGMKEVDKHFIQ